MVVMTASDKPIRLGLQLQPQHADYRSIRDAVLRAEDLGVDIIFNWDHFFPLSGDPDGKHFECWTMLGAWAEQTERVEIGARGIDRQDVSGGVRRLPSHLHQSDRVHLRGVQRDRSGSDHGGQREDRYHRAGSHRDVDG